MLQGYFRVNVLLHWLTLERDFRSEEQISKTFLKKSEK